MSYQNPKRDKRSGRLVLLIVFVVFCALDAMVYVITPKDQHDQFLAAAIIRQIWTIALLAAIWRGHNWARYVLIGLMLVGALFLIPVIGEILDSGIGIPPALIILGIANIAVIATLIYSPAIKTLTGRH